MLLAGAGRAWWGIEAPDSDAGRVGRLRPYWIGWWIGLGLIAAGSL
ncbi:hypothetical protein ACFW1A_31715 [Kitasatospora sp. NPDC058965]